MSLSPITKQQTISIVKNALIAGVASFVIALQATGTIDKPALLGAFTAGLTAIIKTIEKAFTEA